MTPSEQEVFKLSGLALKLALKLKIEPSKENLADITIALFEAFKLGDDFTETFLKNKPKENEHY